jgi:hypothetical protein
MLLHGFFNAEGAENAENSKGRGTANSLLCESMAEMALPLLLNPPSATSASASAVRPQSGRDLATRTRRAPLR